jgi:hypothetical protein
MARKKSVRKPAPKPKVVKKAAPRKAAKKPAAKRAVRKKPPSKAAAGPLGRARVAGTGELDQYFLKDYEARQVFTFLGVRTLKDLEEFSPQQMIDKLTAPMVQTVTRIRKALAFQNRCLAGDQKFAVEVKKQMLASLR